MNKKAIAILGAIFILIVGTLGFLIYSKYASKTPTTTQNPVATTTTANLNPTPTPIVATSTPPAPTSNIVKLTDDQVVSPALFFSGSGITYFDPQGELFQSTIQNTNGQLQLTDKKKLNIPLKPNITKVLWPSAANKYDFMVQTTDASGKQAWSYFNGTQGLYVDLPPQVESLDWMPSGFQIAYVWVDNNKASVSIGNPDTKNFKKLADLWELDDSIHIAPDGSQILYYETTNASAANAINSMSIDGKVFKGLVKNGQNMGVLWSPDGQKFLFAKKDLNTQAYQLWLYNITSGEVKNLGLFSTTDKAVWVSDSNVIYAAVPNTGVAGGSSLTNDSFFRMDTSTLDKKQYPNTGSLPIDGRNLFLNQTADKLFFKNAQDGGLYYLDLSQ